MSKDKEFPEDQVVLTRAEFEALKAKQSDNQMLIEGLAAAIQKGREPYKSPGQIENEKTAQEQSRRMAENQRLSKKIDQQNCPHIMACNPLSSTRDMFNRASFIHHRLDTGAEILMCTNCQKTIWPDDPEYARCYMLNTTNQTSSAGMRFFADPVAAM